MQNKMAVKGTIVVDSERCKGCGVCVVNCPTKTLSLSKNVNGKGYNYVYMATDGCIGCANCAVVCPDSAIVKVYRGKV